MFVIAWLFVLYAVWSHNLVSIQQPKQSPSFDSGGAYWPVAVQLQLYALLASQFLLACILALNEMYIAFFFIVFLFFFTMIRFNSQVEKFSPLATNLALSGYAALDEGEDVPFGESGRLPQISGLGIDGAAADESTSSAHAGFAEEAAEAATTELRRVLARGAADYALGEQLHSSHRSAVECEGQPGVQEHSAS